MAARKATPKRTTKKAARKGAKKLTKKQLAQRKYAAAMRGVRSRAKTAKGGTGAIKKRRTATTLRRKLGLKD